MSKFVVVDATIDATGTGGGGVLPGSDVGDDEYLQIAPNVGVISTANTAVVFQPANVLNNTVDVEGYISAAFYGVEMFYSSGYAHINVGQHGSISSGRDAIYAHTYAANSAPVVVNNAGYVFSADDAVNINAGLRATIANTGQISAGATALELDSGIGDTISNTGAGTISGGVAIHGTGLGANVQNQGVISSTGGDEVISLGGGANITSSGSIQGRYAAITLSGGDDTIVNSGIIAVTLQDAIQIAGDNDYIENSGKISAYTYAIDIAGSSSSTDWIVNDVGGVISTRQDNIAISLIGTAAHIVNHGDLTGSVVASGTTSFVNFGVYAGALSIGSGGALVRNSGRMSFDGNGGDSVISAIYIQGAAGLDDLFVNTASGVVDCAAGDALTHGPLGSLTAVNYGEMVGAVGLYGHSSLTNVGSVTGDIDLFAGDDLVANRGIIAGDVHFTGTGNVYRGQSGDVEGTIYGAGADGRYIGGAADDVFDMTASGAQAVSGGAGDDTFIFTAAGLGAQTVVSGGAGTDSLTFSTHGAIATSAFAHVSSVETINLAAGANTLTVTNAMVLAADYATLTVNGGSGVDTINAAGVVSGTLTIWGGVGADQMTAGSGTEVFGYRAAADSTGTVYDTIAGFNYTRDTFDVSSPAKSVLAVNSAVTTGSLSTATFNSDLAADLGATKLGAHDAVLFTASAGTLAGQTFLVVDVNGTAGYQANADLVIHMIGATGTLTLANFT